MSTDHCGREAIRAEGAGIRERNDSAAKEVTTLPGKISEVYSWRYSMADKRAVRNPWGHDGATLSGHGDPREHVVFLQ